jgi:hypothetical protein
VVSGCSSIPRYCELIMFVPATQQHACTRAHNVFAAARSFPADRARELLLEKAELMWKCNLCTSSPPAGDHYQVVPLTSR